MEPTSTFKKDWTLTPEAFHKMLLQFDEDWERAGEKYEKVRQKLVKFFKWRGCTLPEEYADRTIDRVARRIDEGAELRVTDPYLYFHGVALNVLREHWKEAEREVESLDGLQPHQTPSQDPEVEREQEEERQVQESQHECLDRCATTLDTESLELISEYHQASGGEKIKRRKEMASRLNIPLNALRIRTHRIRGKLETCIEKCMKRSKKM